MPTYRVTSAPVVASGSTASIITGAAVGQMRVTGLTGMASTDLGAVLIISGAERHKLNGNWQINAFIDATSVDVFNSAIIASDPSLPNSNNGSVTWQLKRDATILKSGVNLSPSAITTWAPSTLYIGGTVRQANGNLYHTANGGTSASSGGGPSGTSNAITDGTVSWAFLQSASNPAWNNDRTAIAAASSDSINGDRIELAQLNASLPFVYPAGQLTEFNKSLNIAGVNGRPRITGGLVNFDVRFAAGKSLSFDNLEFHNQVGNSIFLRQVKDCKVTNCRFTSNSAQRFGLGGEVFLTGAPPPKIKLGVQVGSSIAGNVDMISGNVVIKDCYWDPELDLSSLDPVVAAAAKANLAANDPVNWLPGDPENQLAADSGTSSSVASGQLNDLSKTWIPDQFASIADSGALYDLKDSAGISRHITTNTATQIRVVGTPAAGPYTIIKKPWHAIGIGMQGSAPTASFFITGNMMKNIAYRGMFMQNLQGKTEVTKNFIDLGVYGGHAQFREVGVHSAAGIGVFNTFGDRGETSIHDNYIACSGRGQVGIFISALYDSPSPTTRILSVTRNTIVLQGRDPITSAPVDCNTGVLLVAHDRAYIAYNKLEGIAEHALRLGSSVATANNTNHNVLIGNSLQGLRTTISDVHLTNNTFGNIVTKSLVKTVSDSGFGNKVLSPSLKTLTGKVVAGTLEDIIDGETFTINDGQNPASVFEFNKTGGITSPNIAVDLTGFPAAWQPNTVYSVGNIRTNGPNEYTVVAAGTSASSVGPTGQTQQILDGTVRWNFIRSVRMHVATQIEVAINAQNDLGDLNVRASRTSEFEGQAVDLYHTNIASDPPLALLSLTHTVANPAFVTEGLRRDYGVVANVGVVREKLRSGGFLPGPNLSFIAE